MITLQGTRLKCPICEKKFNSNRAVVSGGYVPKTTDFRDGHPGTQQPLAFSMHICQKCGYTGQERDFGEEMEISLSLRNFVINELGQPLTSFVPGSAKFERAAKITAFDEGDLLLIAHYYLCAAWCSIYEEKGGEAERFYRLKSVSFFEEHLFSYRGLPSDDRAVLTYMAGELWRRIGANSKAKIWFDQVEETVVNQSEYQWVIDLAIQQRECPREWYS